MPPKNFLTYVLFLIVKAGHPAIMLYCLYFIGVGILMNSDACMTSLLTQGGQIYTSCSFLGPKPDTS